MTEEEIEAARERLKTHIPAEWGKWVDVPDEWIPRLDQLNTDLEAIEKDYEVHQIKEKFGGLRFYLSDTDDQKEALVLQAELDIEKLEHPDD